MVAAKFMFFGNTDSVSHTVVFANGLCSLELAPGANEGCPFAFVVGQYPYTVDGTIQASVVVNARGGYTKYAWPTGGMRTATTYTGQLRITFPDGTVEHTAPVSIIVSPGL